LKNNFFKDYKITNIEYLSNFLGFDKLEIIDIGCTGGIDPKWEPIETICNFYGFDPDSRSSSGNSKIEIIPNILWSKKECVNLHLTKFPPASSIYPPNFSVLNKYNFTDEHDITHIQNLKATTIDSLFRNKVVDFIKTDAEGADLEILRGAEDTLNESVLALQLETQFIHRNIGSPLFFEAHDYLEKIGYELFHVSREHWVRKNAINNIESRTQIIWADVFYFLSYDKFINRLKCNLIKLSNIKLISKYIIICVTYRNYDYGMDLIENLVREKYISDEEYNILKKFILKNVRKNYQILLTLAIKSFLLFLSLLLTSYNKKRFLVNKIKFFNRLSLLFMYLSLLSKNVIGNKVAVNDEFA
jgi:FkbM family methyltransferase